MPVRLHRVIRRHAALVATLCLPSQHARYAQQTPPALTLMQLDSHAHQATVPQLDRPLAPLSTSMARVLLEALHGQVPVLV